MQLIIPKRKLTNPRRFVIEMAADGFNAYEQQPGGSFELIAASPKAVASELELWEQSVAPAVLNALRVALQPSMMVSRPSSGVTDDMWHMG